MDGLPIGWVTDDELLRGIPAEQVVQRDQVRQDEGSVPLHGYSLEEALLLFQSTSPALRRAGVCL